MVACSGLRATVTNVAGWAAFITTAAWIGSEHVTRAA